MRRNKRDRHDQSVVGCCGGGYNTNTTGVSDDYGTDRIFFDCGTYTTVVVVVAVANVLVPDAPILVVLVLLLRSG